MLAVTEALIIFSFQSLVKQMFVVIAKAALHRCSSRKIIWFIPVINVKRNNFINNGSSRSSYDVPMTHYEVILIKFFV